MWKCDFLHGNHAVFRRLPGTELKNSMQETVYTPSQNPEEILGLMTNLEKFINDDSVSALDPLVKMCEILEAEIDAAVYKLYGLSAEEIKIVEGN